MRKIERIIYYITRALKRLKPRSILNSKIDKRAYICGGSQIVNSTIGKYTIIAQDSTVLYASIGNFCSIGKTIGGAAHPIQMVSSSNAFVEGRSVLKRKFANHPFQTLEKIEIGNDVWVCVPSIVRSGVKIADGAVVGAGSVVTKDIGPYEIWAGCPARFIRKRFDDETIEKLLEIKWWNWEDDKIEKYAQYFNNPRKLIEALSKEENR